MIKLFSFLFLFLKIAGVALHLWTVWIAYRLSGGLAALLTLCLPAIAEVYWMAALAVNVGFLNWFSVACITYVLVWLLAVRVAVSIDREEEPTA